MFLSERARGGDADEMEKSSCLIHAKTHFRRMQRPIFAEVDNPYESDKCECTSILVVSSTVGSMISNSTIHAPKQTVVCPQEADNHIMPR